MGDALLNAILQWMQNNYIRIASFDRIVSSVPGVATYDQVAAVVSNYPGIFRTAKIKGGLPGLALIDGYSFPHEVSAPALNVGELNATAGIAQAPLPENGPVGYAIPAVTPEAPVGYNDTVSQDQPAPTSASLTPKESVEKLIRLAAEADVSGSAVNYANAAVAAATALQLLDSVG